MKSSRDGKPLAKRMARKRPRGNLLDYIRSFAPDEELASALERVLEKRDKIRLRSSGR